MAIVLKDCFFCGGKNQAMVCVATSQHPRLQQIHRSLFACPNCHRPYAAVLVQKDGGVPQPMGVGSLDDYRLKLEVWHPEHSPLAAPPHTPDDVATRYIQGEDNFRQGNHAAASAMFRGALDIATKKFCDENRKKTSLFARIEHLAESGKITADMADWAHQIRDAGNEALHDEGSPERKHVAPLRLFTEMLLRYLFELPGEVAARRAG